jgi:ferredoxin-NADP reductase
MLLTLTLREVERATPRAAIVRLALGGRRFDYLAGQAVLVGRTGQNDRRAYSLATSPAECRDRDEIELLVGLDALDQPGPHLGTLSTGMSVDVEGPLGTFTFPPSPAEHRFLFVAGGTGIAPLRAMLHEALARPGPTHIGVVYSARTPQEFAYGPELRALAAAGRLTLWQTVTREVEDHWDGAQGRIALGHLRSMLHDTETLCFVCGPHTLVREISPLLAQLGISQDRVRVEEWK